MPTTATDKTGKGDPGPGHNSNAPQFTEGDIAYLVRRQKAIDEKAEAVAKEQKGLNREMKRLKVTQKHFKEVYRRLGMSDTQIEKIERERIALAKFMGMPVGTQMGFFDDRPDEFAQKAPENGEVETQAFKRGRTCAMLDLGVESSPYDPAGPDHQEFLAGHDAGTKEKQAYDKEQAEKAKAEASKTKERKPRANAAGSATTH